jgi:hypothetical protein
MFGATIDSVFILLWPRTGETPSDDSAMFRPIPEIDLTEYDDYLEPVN